LGLPQVHGIVGTHEGHIDVESEWERGSTFTVYLPAIPDPSMLPRDEAPPASVQGHGETILVVEDSPTTRQALVESLDALRYHTLTAADGREALDILRQRAGEIDLVLSDVVMPSMGGVALAHALYEQEFDVRILLMTGHPLEQSLSHLRDYGVVDVISKPVSFDLLAEVVARGLKHEC
jgi:CheY-like chemotaxis protein